MPEEENDLPEEADNYQPRQGIIDDLAELKANPMVFANFVAEEEVNVKAEGNKKKLKRWAKYFENDEMKPQLNPIDWGVEEKPDYLQPYPNVVEWVPVGSRVTCDPPVMDTDEDILCFIRGDHPDMLLFMLKTLLRDGWVHDKGGEYNFRATDFFSARDEEKNLNLICTANHEFYQRFLRATKLAKRFNLLKKDDRIALFDAILYEDDQDDEGLV